MPTEDQMERLLMLLEAQKKKVTPPRQPKKKLVVQEMTEAEIPVIEKKPKKSTKKDRDAEKEQEIKVSLS